jgi:hypothetical protein
VQTQLTMMDRVSFSSELAVSACLQAISGELQRLRGAGLCVRQHLSSNVQQRQTASPHSLLSAVQACVVRQRIDTVVVHTSEFCALTSP